MIVTGKEVTFTVTEIQYLVQYFLNRQLIYTDGLYASMCVHVCKLKGHCTTMYVPSESRRASSPEAKRTYTL
jgi:hypothetical protein